MTANRLPSSDAGPGSSEGQSLVEQTLLEILNTTLNRSDIKPTDRFFDLGGDSLLALVTIEQINQRLGWKLDMADLARYSTIRELIANKTIPQAANSERAIVRMSNRGSRTPMVFIHPVSGLVFAYAKLVRSLRHERGCFGIQSPILMDATVPDTIEGIAELYADLIADEFGDEELHLCGWSAGGVIVAELAKILSERGLGLQKLVLIDSHVWNAPPFEATEDATLREFRADMLAQVFPEASRSRTAPQGLDLGLDLGPDPGLDPDAVFREISAALFGADGQRAGDASTQFVQRLYGAYRATFRALAAYRPAPVPSAALLLHADGNDTVDTWRGVMAGGLTVEALGGDHYCLLREPDAARIAAQIDAYCE